MTREDFALSLAQERWDDRHRCDVCGAREDDCTCHDDEEHPR